MKLILKLCLLCAILLPLSLSAHTLKATSGPSQTAVLELFTSEGCGLCPAADRWVHNLAEQGVTDDNVIVLGFHIDYLNDQKGWVDRFASPVFSARQRQQAHLNLYQTIYTPEFVVSGEVIHNWEKHVKRVIHAVNDFIPEVKINLKTWHKKNTLFIDSKVKVEGDENRQYSKLYIALTEDDIESKVTGGDNAGATFHHQNLVRQWLGPFDLNTDGETDLTTLVKIKEHWNLKKMDVVAVVQNLDNGFVLQGLKLDLGAK